MAARNRKYQTEKTRQKIQASMIVNRLQKAFKGEVEMSPVQAKIGLGLLSKIVPDMSHHIQEHIESGNLEELLERARQVLGEDAAMVLRKRYDPETVHEAGHA